jgi:hypothetical protein
MMAKSVRTAGLMAIVTLLCAPAARANAIVNGGFESGLTGWTAEPAVAPGSLLLVSHNSHSGNDAAWFGAIGNHYDSLLQTFDTVTGQSYELDFWVAQDSFIPYNSFSALWDDAPILNLVNRGRFGYTEYSFIETATSDSTTVEFSGKDLVGFYYLDDVSVTPYFDPAGGPDSDPAGVPTPEPASLLLLGTGLTAFVRARRSTT